MKNILWKETGLYRYTYYRLYRWLCFHTIMVAISNETAANKLHTCRTTPLSPLSKIHPTYKSHIHDISAWHGQVSALPPAALVPRWSTYELNKIRHVRYTHDEKSVKIKTLRQLYEFGTGQRGLTCTKIRQNEHGGSMRPVAPAGTKPENFHKVGRKLWALLSLNLPLWAMINLRSYKIHNLK